MKIANLIGTIVNQPGSTLHELMLRQLAVKGPGSHSWFTYAAKALSRYDLPDLHSLLQYPPTAKQWKVTVKRVVTDHWLEELRADVRNKISLKYLQTESCSLQRPHPVWRYAAYHPRQAARAQVKAKLLTGTYTLQGNKHRFNQHEVRSTCPLCKLAPENRLHFIRECRVFSEARQVADNILSEALPCYHSSSEEDKLQTLLDPQCVVHDRDRLERVSARFLYKLHCLRSKALL